jgi:hypothetical protein
MSSQAVWAPATGGPEALLVSPLNVKWRFSVPAGGVEGSKLCLFSVIMPAKCVFSVSPRFHYKRLTFCFLPLAAILESSSLTVRIVTMIGFKTYTNPVGFACAKTLFPNKVTF